MQVKRWTAATAYSVAVASTLERVTRLIVRRGLIYPLILSLLILGLGGLGFWLIDPHVQTFHDGLWLAFTTAATVGYGDLVPTTAFSRLFAVVVVLMGLGVLSLVTASVAAVFVESEERVIERELLHEMARLRAEVARLRADIAAQAGQTRNPSAGDIG
ncbi:MAG: potassium channel family protein [Curvibacter sp.]|jgi:voltage-gated potassium channel|nr:two pore domain potassium channel family protein [Curvibacter sp.]